MLIAGELCGDGLGPDMCDPSTVLSGDMAKSLFGRMPPKIQSQPWKLAFSTQTDGFSLQNLYRTLEGDVDAPVLVVIADATGDVFGAYLTCVPKATFDLFFIFQTIDIDYS